MPSDDDDKEKKGKLATACAFVAATCTSAAETCVAFVAANAVPLAIGAVGGAVAVIVGKLAIDYFFSPQNNPPPSNANRNNVNQTPNCRQTQEASNANRNNANQTRTASEGAAASEVNRIREDQVSNDSRTSRGLCAICCEFRACILSRPCNHVAMCRSCLKKMRDYGYAKCPLCNTRSESTEVVFLS